MFSMTIGMNELLVLDEIAAEMRSDEDVRQIPERAVGRQGSVWNTSSAAPAMRLSAQRLDQRRLIDGLAAAGADVVAEGFIAAKIVPSNSPILSALAGSTLIT